MISSWGDNEKDSDASGLVTTIVSFGDVYKNEKFRESIYPAFAVLQLSSVMHSSWRLSHAYVTPTESTETLLARQTINDWSAGRALDGKGKCPSTSYIWDIVKSGTRLPGEFGTILPTDKNVLAAAVGKKSYHERTVLTCACYITGAAPLPSHAPCPFLLSILRGLQPLQTLLPLVRLCPFAHAVAWPSPSRRFLVLYQGATTSAERNDISLLWYVYKDAAYIDKKNWIAKQSPDKKKKKSFQATQRGLATIIRATAKQSSVAECSFFVSDDNYAVSAAVKKKVRV